MKKICVMIVCIAIAVSFCACNSHEEIMQPANFYYCNNDISFNSDNGVIQPEVRETFGITDITGFLNLYLAGPSSPELYSLIPWGTEVVSLQIAESTIQITMSSAFGELSGMDLVTAASCLLLTLHDHASVEEIRLYTEDTTLDGKDEFVLSIHDIVLMDIAQTKG